MSDSINSPLLTQHPIGDLVTENARNAAVFERFGLDFCCNGHQTLEQSCEEHGVAVSEVLEAMAALGEPNTEDRPAPEWKELDALIQYIVGHHHRYLRDIAPTLNAWLDEVVSRQGAGHVELAEVRKLFHEIDAELSTHMLKEENILFPFISDLAVAKRSSARLPSGPFGTILNPVRVMEQDHQLVGNMLARLRSLTGRYTPPDDACATFRMCYAELARYEQDLHRHIHLENHVLFPGAIELESGLT
jgi:regulator of cell morphogenesis and NO signaling